MAQPHANQKARKFSRRQFITFAVATNLLAGCTSQEQPVDAPATTPPHTFAPANSPVPTASLPPTAASSNTPTVATEPTSVSEVIKFYPNGPSRVVQTHHAGVWSSDQLSPTALRQMLDASISKLTGLPDAQAAWAAVFKPSDTVAIKVNTFENSTIWTHAPLVDALVAALQDSGLPAEQIVIYDHLSMFKEAGYTLNPSGPGVRCLNETDFSGTWQVASRDVRLSSTLQGCTALINMPVLKAHMLAGLTFALKNHYGTVASPDDLHEPIDQCIAELNALPPIKERTRLVIGDILEANLTCKTSWPYWEADWRGDSILMSFDPVAHDTVGMQILEQLQAQHAATLNPALRELATSYLKTATTLGLGTNDPQQMQVEEVTIG